MHTAKHMLTTWLISVPYTMVHFTGSKMSGHSHMNKCIHVYIYMYPYVYVHMYMFIIMYMYSYIYIYIYICMLRPLGFVELI